MEKLLIKLNYCWAVIDARRVCIEKQVCEERNDMVRAFLRGKASAYTEASAEVRKVIAEARNAQG